MHRLFTNLQSILTNRQILLGGIILFIFIIIAILAPFISPHSYWKQDYSTLLRPPGGDYLFGTDQYGRDTFTRIIYGARTFLLAAFGAATLTRIIGILLGLLGGYIGGGLDRLIQSFIDIAWSFPSLLLALVLVVLMEPEMTTIMIAIALGYWLQYAQVIHSEVLAMREEEFVLAARSLGASNRRIIFLHILPNVTPPVIVLISHTMGYAIIVEVSLSFLGLGIQPPMSSWGALLADSRDFLSRAPWLSIFPGLAIALVVLGFNLLGDGLRNLLGPYLKER